MKKAIIIACTILMVPMISQAQFGIGFGIKGGANFANQVVSEISTKTVTNYHVGGYLNLNITNKFGLRPEMLYTANGTKWNDAKLDYSYISIPVMIRIMPVKLISLEAGPQFSFLTSARMEGIGDFKDQLKSNDFGLAFGAGVRLPFGFNVGGRYVLGFTNISDASTESVKNRTIQVYLAWTILGAK